MAARWLLLRRLRGNVLATGLFAFVVFTTSAVAASLPRVVEQSVDAGVRIELADATSAAANLQFQRLRYPAPANGELELVEAEAIDLRKQLPPHVRSVIETSTYHVDTMTWAITDSPPESLGYLILRASSDLGEQIALRHGRWPAPADAGDPIEVMLSQESARQLEAAVGDLLPLTPDQSGVSPTSGGLEALSVRVVGLFDVVDPASRFWFDDRSLHEPTIVPLGIDYRAVHATALTSPDSYMALTELGLPLRYTFRYFVAPGRVQAESIGALQAEMTRLSSGRPSTLSVPRDDVTSLQTGIGSLLARFQTASLRSAAVIVVASVTPALIAILTLLTLAHFVRHLRAPELLALRRRGGSFGQLAASHFLEGCLLAFPAGVLGCLVALELVPARTAMWPAALSTAACIVAVMTMTLVLAWPAGEAPARAPASLMRRARRLVAEACVIGGAALGAILLRERSIVSAGVGGIEQLDAVLAAAPAFVIAAGGLVIYRTYPPVLAAAARGLTRSRGLLTLLGIRRAADAGSRNLVWFIVVVAGVGAATFTSATSATVRNAQLVSSWQTVGAAYRLTFGPAAPAGFDEERLTRITDVATIRVIDVTLPGGAPASLVLLPIAAHERVTTGTPAAVEMPEMLHAHVAAMPLPAVVSQALAQRGAGQLRPGMPLVLSVGSRPLEVAVAAIAERPVHGLEGDALIVVAAHQVPDWLDSRGGDATIVLAAGSLGTAAAFDDMIDQRRDLLVAQRDVLADLRRRPQSAAIGRWTGVLAPVTLGYTVLAVLVGSLLGTQARSRDERALRPLGVSRLQSRALGLIESAPALAIAGVGGIGAGAFASESALRAADVAGLVGLSRTPVVVVLDPSVVGLVGALLVTVAVTAVLKRP